MNSVFPRSWVGLIILTLIACGGGNSGDDRDPPAPGKGDGGNSSGGGDSGNNNEIVFEFSETSLSTTFGKAPFFLELVDSSEAGEIAFESSNPNIASISSDGQVTILGAGEALLSATKTANNQILQTSLALEVEKATQAIAFEEPEPTALNARVGLYQNNLIIPDFNSGAQPKYFTDSLEFVEFDTNTGQIDPRLPGEVVVTAILPGNNNFLESRASYSIKINKLTPDIQFTKSDSDQKTLISNSTFSNVAYLTNPVENLVLSYSSSDTDIADIDNNGVVDLKSIGQVILKVDVTETDFSKAASAEFTLTILDNVTLHYSLTNNETRLRIASEDENMLTNAFDLAISSDVNCDIDDLAHCENASHVTVENGVELVTSLSADNADLHTWLSSDTFSTRVSVRNDYFEARRRHMMVEFKDKLWIIGGDTSNNRKNDIWSSSDGQWWQKEREEAPFTPREGAQLLQFNNQLFLLGGFSNSGRTQDIWVSNDGVNWVEINKGFSLHPFRDFGVFIFNDEQDGDKEKLWILGIPVDESQLALWNSEDGVSWIRMEYDSEQINMNQLVDSPTVFNNALYLFSAGGVYRSNNAYDWQQVSDDEHVLRSRAYSVVNHQGKLWKLGGFNLDLGIETNAIWHTHDGSTWTQYEPDVNFDARQGHASLSYGNRIIVSGGVVAGFKLGDLWQSIDGMHWQRYQIAEEMEPRNGHALLSLNGDIAVVGGAGDRFISWKRNRRGDWGAFNSEALGTISTVRSAATVSETETVYLFGGRFGSQTTNTLLLSDNLETWRQAQTDNPFSARFGHTVTELNGAYYIIGGNNERTLLNDVWRSDDKINWFRITEHAQFPPRSEHQVVAFADKLWLIGGSDATPKPFSDIWSSADGISWTIESEDAEFGSITQHQIQVWNNKIWLIGGRGLSGARSEIWSSDNGVNWTREIERAGFGAVYDHAVTQQADGKFVLFGGLGDSVHHTSGWILGDVWTSTDAINWSRQLSRKLYFDSKPM